MSKPNLYFALAEEENTPRIWLRKSREEAIEKIAKALCLCDDDGGCKGVCNPKCEHWEYFLKPAEAALNALLED